jgi:uncharacterized HhH-GPD family protein
MADPDLSAAAHLRLVSTTAIGAFSWRWPEGIESYERGWLAIADLGGRELHIRHGIGRRDAFGRSRLRSVTWVEGDVAVEGVEADDFSRSESLLSLIKITKKHVRPGDPLPPGYESFPIAVFADEVSGPHSFGSLAVKLRLDDVEGWTRHALLRSAAWGRLSVARRDRPSLPSPSAPGPLPASTSFDTPGDQQVAVAAALLEFGTRHSSSEKAIAVDFTANSAANDLVRTDPFAFLCAVIFDQNVPAERAWLAPFLLKERLGYLDPASIAAADGAVRAAIQQEPKLHRYVNKMPGWIVRAAQRVVDRYDGDASTIWSDNPAADVLQKRFDDFVGIAQKKAAMAVEILERDLGVPVRNLERSDIAYDVHIRRVFLRARLADRDDRDVMIAAARQLHPERPGALDLPTWLIGRGWCHPGVPDCATCPLTQVCPKEVERAAHVTST